MSIFPLGKKSQAYVDGYRNGKTDYALGIRLDYAWFGRCVESSDNYSRNYSIGYRQGWLNLPF
jgi:hypothetical protein